MSERERAASWQVYKNVSYVKSGNFNIVAERILQAADKEMFSYANLRKAAESIASAHDLTPEEALAITKDLAEKLRK